MQSCPDPANWCWLIDVASPVDDLCAVENEPLCEGGCVSEGSHYTCTCPAGLTLREDGVSCAGKQRMVIAMYHILILSLVYNAN